MKISDLINKTKFEAGTLPKQDLECAQLIDSDHGVLIRISSDKDGEHYSIPISLFSMHYENASDVPRADFYAALRLCINKALSYASELPGRRNAANYVIYKYREAPASSKECILAGGILCNQDQISRAIVFLSQRYVDVKEAADDMQVSEDLIIGFLSMATAQNIAIAETMQKSI